MYSFTQIIMCLAALATIAHALPGSGPSKYQAVMQVFASKIENDPKWRKAFEDEVQKQSTYSTGLDIEFNCKVPPYDQTEPKTIHQLRPRDINVIASLGDSITAGNGINALTAVGVLRQDRGESWSIGGDKSIAEGVHTIANLIRIFNPFVNGFSTDSGTETSSNAWLNQAVAGAKAEDVPGETDRLIELMKTDPRIDFHNDWKMITLLIGGNDMCDYCQDRARYSPTMMGKHLKTALDKLHAQVPRALVNLVPMADVTPVPQIRTGWLCSILHRALCDCARNELTRDELKPIQLQFAKEMEALANSGRYDTRDDFTVVLQPNLIDQKFPKDKSTGKYDASFIAPDCFHPNRKAHQGFAWLLWNNMLRPVGQKIKSEDLDSTEKMIYKCPTEETPYIFTNKNSPKTTTQPKTLRKIIQSVKHPNVPQK